MSPKTLEERMATMEAEYGHVREDLRAVTNELRKTNALLTSQPRLMAKKVRRHARECPGNPAATNPPARPPAPPAPDPDWGWVRKAVAGLLVIGSLVAGYLSPPRTPDPDRPAIAAPASPATTGGQP